MQVYLDNGATTKVDLEVVEEMKKIYLDNYGNASSLHNMGKIAKQKLDESRKIISELINCKSSELFFTSGGTESDNFAIKGYALANLDKGNHIITSKIEHPAVLSICEELEKEGFIVSYIDVDSDGIIKLDDLKNAITNKTILVSIMHANNEIGTIQPIDEIGKICKEKKIAFHTDAVQSFTKIPIDVKKYNIDLISLSGHKIHGPKGIGALYIRDGIKIKPFFYGGGQEQKLRPGTENIAGIVGFAIAAKNNHLKNCDYVLELREMLIKGLLTIPQAKINGSLKNRLCNNVNVSFSFVEGESILINLNFNNIYLSTGSACSSKSLKPSHVLLALGITRKDSHGTIRFTLSKYNTKEEIEYTIQKVRETICRLRQMSPLNENTINEYNDLDKNKCN
jgi:cysteine desulfurase